MVKRSLLVTLLCLHGVAFPKDGPPDQQKDIVKQLCDAEWYFKEFKELNSEDKNTVFNKFKDEDKTILTNEIIETEYKKLTPEQKKEIFKNANVKLPSQEIIDQYISLPKNEKDVVLIDLLKRIEDPQARKDLLDEVNKTPTLSKLLENPSTLECGIITKHTDPQYFGTIPVIEWVNLSHWKNYFQPTMTETFVNRDCFNEFNSFNQWGLWIVPYGLSTQFKQESDNHTFDFNSLGISVGGEIKLFDRLVLGIGASYSRSNASLPEEKITTENVMNNMNWDSKYITSATINSLYLGPYVGYVFNHGYLSLSLLGAGNFYDIQRKMSLQTLFNQTITSKLTHSSEIDHTSWDLLARLEGGLSYSPGQRFFFYPTMRFDYLNVFEQGLTDELNMDEDNIHTLSVESLNTSFLTSKIGLKITREFFNNDYGFLIPGLSLGWIYFTPLTAQHYQYKIDTCEEDKKVKINPWNQYFIGANFTIIQKRGILLTLDYEVTLGANASSQSGLMRFELSW